MIRVDPARLIERVAVDLRARRYTTPAGLFRAPADRMTIAEAAAAIGVSPATVCRIEAGRWPAADVLVRVLAWLYGLDLDVAIEAAIEVRAEQAQQGEATAHAG